MSRVVSLRLPDDDASRLERIAVLLGRTPGETARLLLEEKLREEEFPFVEFRQTHAGRLAYLKGSRLAVWYIAMLARDPVANAASIAGDLRRSEREIASVLRYADAFRDEVQPFVDSAMSMTLEDMRRIIPWVKPVRVPE